MDTSFTLISTAKHTGMTLYEFLTAQFPFFNVDNWADAIIENSLFINAQPMTNNPVLSASCQVQFTLRNYYEDPVNTNWQLIWQNNSLLVVNKPALLPVQRTTRNIYNTLTSLVRRDLNLPQAQALHRLDLETAGLIVFAKTKVDTLACQPKFKTLLQEKMYRAVVWGKPEWQVKEFTSQLNKRSDSEIRCQIYVSETDTIGKTSTTHFKVIQSNEQFSIVECELITGRKHQLRAQLAYLGHPIVGDKIYAHDGVFYLRRLQDELTEKDRTMLKAPHHLLVACNLNLAFNDEIQVIRLPEEDYPEAWQTFIEAEFR